MLAIPVSVIDISLMAVVSFNINVYITTGKLQVLVKHLLLILKETLDHKKHLERSSAPRPPQESEDPVHYHFVFAV